MERRDFLKQAAITAAAVASTSQLKASKATPAAPIARRTLGKTGEQLSIIGFGGIVVMDEDSGAASNIVAEAVDRGINYFDVAPSYGNAQERLGPALAPYRNRCFLACKTEGRMKDDSRKQLEQSLKLLKTDHLDLYQFHALTKMRDLDKVLGPGGAMETMEAAKKEGKIRYIGFSVHSVETALAAMDRYNFDTVLFPVNWVLFTQAGFGPQILKRAQEKKMGILALKSMAKTSGSKGIQVYVPINAVGGEVSYEQTKPFARRIAELLVATIDPTRLLAAKVLASAATGVIQLAIWIVVGGTAGGAIVGLFGESSSSRVPVDLGPVALPPAEIIALVAFFLVGFVQYAVLYAAAASLINRTEDLGSVAGPLVVPVLFGFVLAQFALEAPNSSAVAIYSQIPLLAPFVMFTRIAVTDVPVWQIVLSLAVNVAAAAALAWFAGKVYRFGLLLYGRPPSFAQVVKILRS